ncbi:cyclase [Caulobacter flavus]|uniref:Cyclase n=1 Tax=Caulobacter flavus TaxID=1679497 RepID=A0A2N5CKD1_9CAUL|nr:SRPBCC family protein [Caulobacter flavus]AYV47698.1 cyclase [Caulobacter flavus]PLR05802.1 cyclase [Caulobacter flavus]
MPTDTDAPITPANLVKQPGDQTYVSRAITIDRSRDVLYAFWRDPKNLQRLMDNVERIDVVDERRSHWVVKGPAGADIEWDSLIVEDDPGRRIAWRAEEGAQVANRGWVEFRDGPPGRGTEVHALIEYDAPGGVLGRLIAKLFQREPNTQTRRELRRFKQLMETGEITTSEGPRGAGRHEKEEA